MDSILFYLIATSSKLRINLKIGQNVWNFINKEIKIVYTFLEKLKLWIEQKTLEKLKFWIEQKYRKTKIVFKCLLMKIFSSNDSDMQKKKIY